VMLVIGADVTKPRKSLGPVDVNVSVVPLLSSITTSSPFGVTETSLAQKFPPTAVTGAPVKVTRIFAPELLVEIRPGALYRPGVLLPVTMVEMVYAKPPCEYDRSGLSPSVASLNGFS